MHDSCVPVFVEVFRPQASSTNTLCVRYQMLTLTLKNSQVGFQAGLTDLRSSPEAVESLSLKRVSSAGAIFFFNGTS